MTTSQEAPETMKCLSLTGVPEAPSTTPAGSSGGSTNDHGTEGVKIEVRTVPVPRPGPGQVLVKVTAAPLNPSDYGAWTRTPKDKLPSPVGTEGSGVVVLVGPGMMGSLMCPKVGDRVGFALSPNSKKTQGSMSEYVVVGATTDILTVLPPDLPVEDGASFFVNPYTAFGIVDTVWKTNGKAFVHTAASSQVGHMIVKLCALDKDVTPINVVKREDKAKALRDVGAEHVVVTGDDDPADDTEANRQWKAELKRLIDCHGASCAFDAVAGSMTGILLDLMPKRGEVFVYGRLAGEISNVDPTHLIYRSKKLNGWLLNRWYLGSGGGKNVGSLLAGTPKRRAAARKVNSGLKDGWSASTFVDAAVEEVFDKFVEMRSGGGGFTGKKLRVRFDLTSSSSLDSTSATQVTDS